MMRAALHYAANGFCVLPIARATKQPACEHGVHSATTDADKIRAWWSRTPDANIAVRCDTFWVLDVDPRHGGDATLERWTEDHGPLPQTWTARTGSGGAHFFFAHEPAFEPIPLGKLGDSGIDVKGCARHYVVAAPSRSSSGPYSWVVSPRERLARAPRWLVHLVVQLKRPPVSKPAPKVEDTTSCQRLERARRYARALPPAISGSNGHAATFRAAMIIGRGFGLSEDDAFDVLAEWNQTCVPPWSERELRRKVVEALRCGSMPVGALLGM